MGDALRVLILWLVLTALGEAMVFQLPFPPAMAVEAQVVDEAFRYLWIIGTPVFAFVLSILLYSLLRFRVAGDPPEDGPPVFGHAPGSLAWLVVTSLLALSLAVQPGLQGLLQLSFPLPSPVIAFCQALGFRLPPTVEGPLIVQVQARQWSWTFNYPQYQIQSKDRLVLPLGRPVRFELTSEDVLHSFWIPAFRMKMDAVPGYTTSLTLTPSEPGRTDIEPTLRVQCAELCGTGHSRMEATVEVISPDQFAAWVDQQRQKQK